VKRCGALWEMSDGSDKADVSDHVGTALQPRCTFLPPLLCYAIRASQKSAAK